MCISKILTHGIYVVLCITGNLELILRSQLFYSVEKYSLYKDNCEWILETRKVAAAAADDDNEDDDGSDNQGDAADDKG